MMIQVLWHKLKLWKSLASGIIPVGLLLIVTYNIAATPAVQQNLQSNPPPEIIGFTLCPPDLLFPGAIIRIQVDVKSNGHRIDKFHWLVETGEGVIIDGNGDSQITYQASKTPGTYQINVELEYEGLERVRGSTIVEVVPEAVVVAANGLNLRFGPGIIYDPPIGYLRSGDILDIKGRIVSNEWIQVVPASNPEMLGWVSAWDEYVEINVEWDNIPIVEAPPLPTSTPTPPAPVLAHAPTLLKPPNGTYTALRNRLDLEWMWDGTLGPDDYYRVEIWNKYNNFSTPIDVAWVKALYYKYDQINEAYDREYLWRITVVRGKPVREKDWSHQVWEPGNQFELVSEESLIWTLFAEPGLESPPPTDDNKDKDKPGPGCRPTC